MRPRWRAKSSARGDFRKRKIRGKGNLTAKNAKVAKKANSVFVLFAFFVVNPYDA
jgi:hypothetical protein